AAAPWTAPPPAPGACADSGNGWSSAFRRGAVPPAKAGAPTLDQKPFAHRPPRLTASQPYAPAPTRTALPQNPTDEERWPAIVAHGRGTPIRDGRGKGRFVHLFSMAACGFSKKSQNRCPFFSPILD